MAQQVTVQPEPLAAGLVAAHYRTSVIQSEALLGAGDLPLQGSPIPTTDGSLARPLSSSYREAEFPLSLTQLECQQQPGAFNVSLFRVGCCCTHGLSPFLAGFGERT